jgi:hypothetical protein
MNTTTGKTLVQRGVNTTVTNKATTSGKRVKSRWPYLRRDLLAFKLLIATLLFLAVGLSQPTAAQAQSNPPGTGKTLSAVLLGKEEPVNEFPWQVSQQAPDADTERAAKMPGMNKVSDVTLKRG